MTIQKRVTETSNKHLKSLAEIISKAKSVLSKYSSIDTENKQQYESLSRGLDSIISMDKNLPANYFNEYFAKFSPNNQVKDLLKIDKELFDSIEKTHTYAINSRNDSARSIKSIESGWEEYVKSQGQKGSAMYEAWRNFVETTNLDVGDEPFGGDFDSFNRWTKLLGGTMGSDDVLKILQKKQNRQQRRASFFAIDRIVKAQSESYAKDPWQADFDLTWAEGEFKDAILTSLRSFVTDEIILSKISGELDRSAKEMRSPVGSLSTDFSIQKIRETVWSNLKVTLELLVKAGFMSAYQIGDFLSKASLIQPAFFAYVKELFSYWTRKKEEVGETKPNDNHAKITPVSKNVSPAVSKNSWEYYVSKTQNGDKLRSAWEGNPPVGYDKSYGSFVNWYKNTNPKFKESSNRDMNVEDAISLLAKKEEAKTPPSFEELKKLDEKGNPTTTVAKPESAVSTTPQEIPKVKPVSQDEISMILGRLMNGVITNISVLEPGGTSKVMPAKGKISSTIRRRIKAAGGEEKVASEIFARKAKDINSNLQDMYEQYVAENKAADFAKVRSSVLAGMIYNAINNVWVASTKSPFKQGMRERKIEREKRRLQKQYDKQN